jgi:PAS domain S-box-containing protein
VARRVDPAPALPPRKEALGDLTAVESLPILLVDDRTENLQALEAVLAPLGYPLQTATSGYKALRLLLQNDFALILLDVRMPTLDGLETARLIKSRERSRDVPIVFMTAARDEVSNVIRGYGVGAVDYVMKPFDAELLRSKVAVFVELEAGRRALKRSETFLQAAFDAAPVGKTVLDGTRKILRSNPAFARLVAREVASLQGVPIEELCVVEDREALAGALDLVAAEAPAAVVLDRAVDLRLMNSMGAELWVALVASSIEPAELSEPLLLAQWVDLSSRRRAESARAELLMEQAARTQAEQMNDRLRRLQTLSSALESLSLEALLPELATRLAEMFDAEVAEVRTSGELGQPVSFRVADFQVRRIEGAPELAATEREPPAGDRYQQLPLLIDGTELGALSVLLPVGRSLTAADRSLLNDVAERAALSVRRAQLHEHEHWIALELQRGLLPKRLPDVAGIQVAAHYQAAGVGAEAGGDWYDAFPLPGGSIGVVVGDVTGQGIPAASAMGQLRSVTRAFALADDGDRTPGAVLTRLNRHQVALGHELFTVIYAIVDPGAGTVSVASAGHPPPLLRSASGEARYLEGGEGLMGMDDVTYKDLRAPIRKGDSLILYTDGLVERRGESLDVGLARLADAAATGPEDADALCAHVLRAVLPAEQRLHDDVTAVVVRIA